MNKYYNLINKAEEETADLYIEGVLVEEGWEREWLADYWEKRATASSEFANMLKELNGKPLKIHCNSCGGSLFAGTAMYTALTEYKGKKTGYIGAMCASAATFPMLACDKVYMTAASGYCAHLPMTVVAVFGNRQDIEEAADEAIKDLKAIESVMIDAYQRKTGLGAEKIRNILEKDEVISAKQAIEYGFVDGYTEDEPKFDKEFVENMFRRNVAVYNSLKVKQDPSNIDTQTLTPSLNANNDATIALGNQVDNLTNENEQKAKNMNIYSFDCNCVARCTVERFKQFVSNPTIQYENDIDRIALKAMEGCYMPCYKK